MYRRLSFHNLPWAPNWAKVFGSDQDLIVEVGFGNGDHLIHLARKHPDANIIGVEIANKSMEKAEKKIINQRLKNVKAIHARGETLLHHLLETGTVHAFHINYPDPWFKSRHEGRRFMKPDTIALITDRLQSGGTLHLATDIIEYAEMSHEILSTTRGLENTFAQPWVNELPGRFVTKYEAKGYREGRPGNYFIYKRTDEMLPPIPTIREIDMPHIVLHTPMSLNEIADQFERTRVQVGDTYVSLLDAFINKQRPALLFEVAVQEPTIDQHIGIVLFPRTTEQEYILRLGSLGHPRATVGLHHATAIIANWIVSLHPDAKILSRKVKT